MRGEAFIQEYRSNFFIKYAYSISLIILFMFFQVTKWYFPLSLTLFGLTLILVLDKLGKGIVLRELIALHSLFVCLVIPILGYTVYNYDDLQARLWFRFMPVPAEEYFGFAFPAMNLFILALCWPVNSVKASDQGELMQRTVKSAREQLMKMHRLPLYIMGAGMGSLIITPFLPEFLNFVATLLFWSSFAGALYLFYVPVFKYKRIILIAFALLIFVNALQNGMFTLVAYMGITIFSFLFLGRKMALWKKILVFFISIFFLLLIQGVKGSYRKYVWRGYQGNKAVLFGKLLTEHIGNLSNTFSEDTYFYFYYRTNQGFNVALVMRRFPDIVPHDNGKNLSISLASSLVPRLFWPDKPEAGGKFNMRYYIGVTVKGWSTNVGPLGEAYGSFGIRGGIIYMCVLGAFIRWAYQRIFVISKRLPLLIFWIPVLFYQITYSAETDTLQIVNSLFKSAFFVWILYKLLPEWFGVMKKQRRRSPVATTQPTLNTPG